MTQERKATPQSGKIIKVDKSLSRRFQFVIVQLCKNKNAAMHTRGIVVLNAMPCNAPNFSPKKRHHENPFPSKNSSLASIKNQKIRILLRGRLS